MFRVSWLHDLWILEKLSPWNTLDAHYNCTPDFWSPVSDRKRLPIGRRVFPSDTVWYPTLVTLGMWEVVHSLGRMYFCMEELYLQLEMWLPLLFCSALLKYFLSHYSIIKTATPSERKCLKYTRSGRLHKAYQNFTHKALFLSVVFPQEMQQVCYQS